MDGLHDEPRPEAPRQIGDDEIADTIRLTLDATPPGATHWSLRSMAVVRGRDKPEALHRTQPLLPMSSGQVERRTHDYTRYGTTSLFAALDVATGAVVGQCYPKHRSGEFRTFLDQIEAAVPAGPDLHLVMDDYATHKTKPIRNWLLKRPRWHVHFIPTGASWINQVKRFFALITDRQIERGIHRSTQALEADIRAFIDIHDTDPEPFRWIKSADDTLTSIQRYCQQA